MVVRYALVADKRAVGHLAGLHEGFQAVFQPALHPLSDRETIGVERKTASRSESALASFVATSWRVLP